MTRPALGRQELARRARLLLPLRPVRSASAAAILAANASGQTGPVDPAAPIDLAALAAAPDWMLLSGIERNALARSIAAACGARALRHSLDGAALAAFANSVGEDLADWALALPPDDAVPSDPPATAANGHGVVERGHAVMARVLMDGPGTGRLAALLGAPADVPAGMARWALREALAHRAALGGERTP